MTVLGENEEYSIFADATADLDDARVVILGVPFDGTSSHRTGSAQAPRAIRRESYNFESYLPRYGCDLESIPFHDIGDVQVPLNIKELMDTFPGAIEELIKNDKFLITLGGEHSITIPILKTHQKVHPTQEFGVIYLDAHFDFRNSYLDEEFSHACVARRVSELVGVEKIIGIGIRSYSLEEAEDAEKMKMRFINADLVQEHGMQKTIEDALGYLGTDKIYLSIDMDVLDPAYAPGVGNPEYFGLNPWQIREAIETLAPKLIGADLVEISPPYDNGNTAALAAQLVQIIISQVAGKLKNR